VITDEQQIFLSDYQKVKKASDEEEVEEETLKLSEDIYCITFIKLMKSSNPALVKDLVLKSCMTFMIQVILSIVIWQSSGGIASIYPGDYMLNSTRLVCAFLLHFSIIPEIKDSLGML